jgi:hypothetical protein
MSSSLKAIRTDQPAKPWALTAVVQQLPRFFSSEPPYASGAKQEKPLSGLMSWPSRNIVDHPLGTLLAGRLDYTQVAPPGFLFCEKIV